MDGRRRSVSTPCSGVSPWMVGHAQTASVWKYRDFLVPPGVAKSIEGVFSMLYTVSSHRSEPASVKIMGVHEGRSCFIEKA